MDWQTSITLLIFAIAAGILFRRVWAFLRSGRTGKCGSCAGCGDSAADAPPRQLVALGSGSKSDQIKGYEGRSQEAGVEKTG